jgi:hypothetical protein
MTEPRDAVLVRAAAEGWLISRLAADARVVASALLFALLAAANAGAALAAVLAELPDVDVAELVALDLLLFALAGARVVGKARRTQAERGGEPSQDEAAGEAVEADGVHGEAFREVGGKSAKFTEP